MSSFQPNKHRCVECARLHGGSGDTCERCRKAERREAQANHDRIVRAISRG